MGSETLPEQAPGQKARASSRSQRGSVLCGVLSARTCPRFLSRHLWRGTMAGAELLGI
jgi:hypothetical protein